MVRACCALPLILGAILRCVWANEHLRPGGWLNYSVVKTLVGPNNLQPGKQAFCRRALAHRDAALSDDAKLVRYELLAPRELLSAFRFDLCAKLLYAQHRALGVRGRTGDGIAGAGGSAQLGWQGPGWARQVYAEHLRVWNAFSETCFDCDERGGDPTAAPKQRLQDYVTAFDALIRSVRRHGFRLTGDGDGDPAGGGGGGGDGGVAQSIIPVAYADSFRGDGTPGSRERAGQQVPIIVDGAHRVAAAAALELVPAVPSSPGADATRGSSGPPQTWLPTVCLDGAFLAYPAGFFVDRRGLGQAEADAMAVQFAEAGGGGRHLRLHGMEERIERDVTELGRAGADAGTDPGRHRRPHGRGHRRVVAVVMLPAAVGSWARRHKRTGSQEPNTVPVSGVDEHAWRGAEGTAVQEIDRVGNVVYQRRVKWSWPESDGLVDDGSGTIVDPDGDSWEAAQAMELLLYHGQDTNSGVAASKARERAPPLFSAGGRVLQGQLQLWLCEAADDGTGATREVAGGQQVQWLAGQLRSALSAVGVLVVEGESAVQLARTVLGQSPTLNAEVALAMSKAAIRLRTVQELKRPLDWWWRQRDSRRKLAPWTAVTDGLDAWSTAFSNLRRHAIARASGGQDTDAVAALVPEWMCVVGETVDVMRGAAGSHVDGADGGTGLVVDVVYFRPSDLRRTAVTSGAIGVVPGNASATAGAVVVEYSMDEDGLDRYHVHFGRAHARESLRVRVVNALFGTDRVHDVVFRSPDHAYLLGHKVAVTTWASGASVSRSLKHHRAQQACGTGRGNGIDSAHARCEPNIAGEPGDEHHKNSASELRSNNDVFGASLRVHSPEDGSTYVLPADVPLSFALHLDPNRLREVGVLSATTANMSDAAIATILRQRLHLCLAINGAPPPGAPVDSIAANASHGLQGYMCLSGPIEQQLGPLSIGGFNAGSHTVGAKLLASGRPKRVLATAGNVLFDVLPSVAPREQQGGPDQGLRDASTSGDTDTDADADTDTDIQSAREDVDRLRRALGNAKFQLQERQHSRLRQYYVEQRSRGNPVDGGTESVLVPRVGLVGNCLRLGGMKMVFLQQARALNYLHNHHLQNEESPTGRRTRTGAAAFAVEYLAFVYSGPLLPLLYVAGVPVRRIAFKEADVEAAVAFLTGMPAPVQGSMGGDAARARTSVAPPAEELRLFDGLSAAPAPLMHRFFDLVAPILAQVSSVQSGWAALPQPVRLALRPLRSALKPLALVSQANSRDTRTAVVFHVARLSGVGARLLELPNLHPPRDLLSEQQWRGSDGSQADGSAAHAAGALDNQNAVTVMVAPSKYVATHSSVAALATALGERVQVIHPMVDTARFKPQASHDTQTPSSGTRVITVGMVCRMSAERSPALMLHVARLLGQGNDNATQYNFVIGGDGPLMPHMRRLAHQLGLVPPRLKFLGGVDHDNMPRLLESFDVFVNTAAGGEIFGVAVAEAMSMARLVVSCSNGAAPELLGGIGEPVGFLTPCHDVTLLAGAVRRAAHAWSTAARDRKRIGALARGRAVRRFSADAFAWRYAALWARALLKRGDPAEGRNGGKAKPRTATAAESAPQSRMPHAPSDTSAGSVTRAPLTITISSPGDGARVLADGAGPVFAAAEIMLEGGVDATQFMRTYRGSELCFTALALEKNSSTVATTIGLGTAFESVTATQSGIYLEDVSSLRDAPRERRVGCWALQSQRMALVGLQPGRWIVRLYLVTESGRVVARSGNAPQITARADVSADDPPVFPEGLLHDYVSPKRSHARAAALLPRLRQLAISSVGSGARHLSVMDVGSNVGYFSLRIGLELGRGTARIALPVRVLSVEGGDTAERSKWGMEAAPLLQHRAARARLRLGHANELCDAVMDLSAIQRFRDVSLSEPLLDVSLLLSVLHWLPLGAHDTRGALQAIGSVLLMARTSFVELPGTREYEARPDVQGHKWLPALLASDDVRRYADEGARSDVSALLLAAAAEVGHYPKVRKVAAFRRFEPNIDRELLEVSLVPGHESDSDGDGDRKTTRGGLNAADCFERLRDILRCKKDVR